MTPEHAPAHRQNCDFLTAGMWVGVGWGWGRVGWGWGWGVGRMVSVLDSLTTDWWFETRQR